MASVSPPLFPLFLKLAGERCLIVGGGTMASHKAGPLLDAGASIHFVDPTPGTDVAALDAAHAAVTLSRRAFEVRDVEGCRLVIAATDDSDVNTAVAEAARAARVLVNVVDVVPLCDFYTGGVVRRGPLQVVTGTSGASPSLARRVRLLLEESLSAGLGPLGAALGAARPALLARYPSFKERAKLLDGFVERAMGRVGDTTTEDEVQRWIDEELLDEH